MSRKITYRFKKRRFIFGCLLFMFSLFTMPVHGQNFESSTPAANSVNVAIDADIVLTYTSVVDLNAMNTFIYGSVSGKISGNLSPLGGGTTSNAYTFDPTNDFKHGEIITVQIIGGGSGPATSYNFSFRTLTQKSYVTANSTITRNVMNNNDGNSGGGAVIVAVGDLDNDGDQDIVSTEYLSSKLVWYENDGNANFTADDLDDSGVTNDGYVSVVLGDADNDGDLDIFYGGWNGQSIYYMENNGGGSFGQRQTITTDTEDVNTIILGDFDGDGLLDLAATYKTNHFSWYKNTTTVSTISFIEQTPISTGLRGAYGAAAGDMDGDGDLDVIGIASANNAGDLWLYYNTGTGFSTDPDYYHNIVGDGTGNDKVKEAKSVAVGDIDGDGDLDVIVTAEQNNKITWYRNNGTNSFVQMDVVTEDITDPVYVDLADMDGDGDLDVIWASRSGIEFGWSRNERVNSGDTVAVPWTTFTIDDERNRGYSIAAADLNNNGKLEIITVSYTDDTVAWHQYDLGSWKGKIANSDWNTASNWDSGVVPGTNTTVNIFSNTNAPTISGTNTIKELYMENPNTGIMSITGSGSLTVTNDVTIDSNTSLTMEHGTSLLVNGTLGGGGSLTLTYDVDIPGTNWHLVSAPVTGEQYDNDWITANNIASGTLNANNRGIGTYDNTTGAGGSWSYFEFGGSATNFNTAQGYAMLRNTVGKYSFIGSMANSDQTVNITANSIGESNENRWNLVGNPFPAYIDIAKFLTDNAAALHIARSAAYVWNGTAYVALTTGYIHPGQGFFVNASTSSANISINKDMLSHQTGVTYHRNGNNDPKMEIHISDALGNTSATTVKYLSGKTTGLDPRFDLGAFSGDHDTFSIYTHLVSENEGIDFIQQTLPNNEQSFNNTIIPISLKTSSANKLTFHVAATHFPEGVKIYLEDIEKGTFVRLDEANAKYEVTVDGSIEGAGRFYIHTRSKASDLETYPLDVHIYHANKAVHLVGIEKGTSAKVAVYDILGKTILEKEIIGDDLNTLMLPNSINSGVYIVRLKAKEGNATKKIVIE